MANTLERLFGSRTRGRLLGWLFTHAEEEFFVRQLGTIIREDSANLSRELARLERLGILTSARRGNLKYFRVKQDCPFFSELKSLVLKTAGVTGQIRDVLQSLPGIKYASVYGSFARGEETAESDVDLLIIGTIDISTLDTVLHDLETNLGREINYVLYDVKEFKAKKKGRDGFITDVLAGSKIPLVGDLDGLEAA
jgi:predicted nucleotidyltransferase